MKTKLYPKIQAVTAQLDITSIPESRKPVLHLLIDYIQKKKLQDQAVNLNFICTHNSRRSHLSQIWAQTMAARFNVQNVHCFSGGTEATALYPKVVETLIGQGFQIELIKNDSNPVYSISFAKEASPVIGFSKTYDDDFNPKSDFAAVMTCSHADENCPFVAGCDARIALTYEDPKLFDNTPQQTEKYKERSLQIATEMKYVFSNII